MKPSRRPSSNPSTVGELKKTEWRSRSVRDEMRGNLIAAIREGKTTAQRWPGILGFENTVLPQIENAILSRHDFILLGLRGQAKTRILRMLVNFLDEEMPAIAGTDLNDDPITSGAPDDAELVWIPRADRYREKLATPDVTIADLLGDIDPIKAATRRLSLADRDVLHFGIIPRTNRGIFAINELPDLSPRIQVGLLNILEERDVQLRGFPVRFPLDLMLVFSANPEDYTNRGSIITPLRDRIASQVITHYPRDLATARTITEQEAWTKRDGPQVHVPELLKEIIEEVAVQARKSEMVDQASGVSVRLTVSLLENVVSNAERRALLLGKKAMDARLADLFAARAAVTGKIELVFEGEREGAEIVADRILGEGVSAVFQHCFPEPYQGSDPDGTNAEKVDVYKPIIDWFASGKTAAINDETETLADLHEVPGLMDLVKAHLGEESEFGAELVLEGLHRSSLVAKAHSDDGVTYSDMLQDMFQGM